MRATLLLLLFIACGARADFESGNRAYDEGKFLEARQHYEAEIARGKRNANLFYNLGNANERLGAAGLAMLNYERALVMQPMHEDARANLKFLQEQSGSTLPEGKWSQALFGMLSVDRWIVAASLAAWLTLFSVAIPYARGVRLGSAGVFWLALLICVSAYAAVATWKTWGEFDAGVIVASRAEARQAPTGGAALVEALPSGSRVRLLGIRGEWTFCVLPGGGRAWLPSASVERVRLSDPS